MVREKIDLKKSDGTILFPFNNLPGSGSGSAITGEWRRMNIDNFLRKKIDGDLVKERWTKGDTETKIRRITRN